MLYFGSSVLLNTIGGGYVVIIVVYKSDFHLIILDTIRTTLIILNLFCEEVHYKMTSCSLDRQKTIITCCIWEAVIV